MMPLRSLPLSLTVLWFTWPLMTGAASSTSLSYFAAITTETIQQLGGTAVAGIGDINNDGYEDLAISAPDAGDQGEGAIYIVYGQASRIDGLLFEDLPTLTGESTGDHLGQQLGALGDVNADGYDDFAVVSNYHDDRVTNPGTVYLIYGQANPYTNGSVRQRPRFYGENKGDGAGAAVQAMGDLNSDGFGDFAIGATWRDSRSGGVYLIYGQAASFADEEDLADYPLLRGDDYDYAGSALAAGDVTNDGVSDLLVSARRHNHDTSADVGYVYIVPGRVAAYADQPLENFSSIYGMTAYEKIGNSLAVGDVTGDGYNDVVIGASASDADGENAGTVYVLPGTATLPASQSVAGSMMLSSETASDLFGSSVAVAEDLDGDGIDDLLYGAPSDLDSKAGRAFVTLGSSTLVSHAVTDDYPFTGEVVGDTAGAVVTTADLDGDGVDEIVTAAAHSNGDGGKVYIGYWPIYTCENSVALGGILANYPTADYKLRRYAANDHYKIVVERHGRQGFVVNCVTNTIVQTLTFNERVQRKILARVFRARATNMFIAVTRTPSKRRIKVFLYQQTEAALVETDYLRRKWRPRGFRIKLNRRNRVVLQKGQEKQHRLKYQISQSLEFLALD